MFSKYLMLISCLAFSKILKVEATCSTEISLDFNGLHIVVSQDRTLNDDHCENINSYSVNNVYPLEVFDITTGSGNGYSVRGSSYSSSIRRQNITLNSDTLAFLCIIPFFF
jgi:hypothetical protein